MALKPRAKSVRTDRGGQGESRGSGFQTRVAAWLAVRMLADIAPPWCLPDASRRIIAIQCNSAQAVDDVLVQMSDGGFAFVQAKFSLDVSTKSESAFAAVIDQFCRQFLAWEEGRPGDRWERPLDPTQDAIVLAVSTGAGARLRTAVPGALERISERPPAQPLDRVSLTLEEKAAWNAVHPRILHTWTVSRGEAPNDDELRRFARTVRVLPLGLTSGEPDHAASVADLSRILVAGPSAAPGAWDALVETMQARFERGLAIDRTQLVEALKGRGYALAGRPDFRAHRRRLTEVSDRARAELATYRSFRAGPITVRIERSAARAVVEHAQANPLVLVTGGPGAGKSAVIAQASESLAAMGDDVLVLTAHTAAEELGGMDIAAVLRDWLGTGHGWLFIDALDAARSLSAQATLRRLISDVAKLPGRWRLVATCRTYDLRHSADIREVFAGSPHYFHKSGEFKGLCHVHVLPLDDAELAQVAIQSPALDDLRRANSILRDSALRNPFHLSLLGRMVGTVTPDEMASVSGTSQLLDLYWERTVVRSRHPLASAHHTDREGLLTRACEQMVESHRLLVKRATLSGAAASGELESLMRDEVLVAREVGGSPDDSLLRFPHHALFDYAVARLILRPMDAAGVTKWLAEDAARVLAVRPSIDAHLDHLWAADPTLRHDFWALLRSINDSPALPEICRLAGPGALARLVVSADDLGPLLAWLRADRNDDAESAVRIMGLLLGAVEAHGSLTAARASPWANFAKSLASEIGSPPRLSVLGLVDQLAWALARAEPGLSEADAAALHAAAVRALAGWVGVQTTYRWGTRRMIDVVGRTITWGDADTERVLRRLLEPQLLSVRGYEYISELAEHALAIFGKYPAVGEELFAAAFEVENAVDRQEALSQLPAMSTSTSQDYGMGRWRLAEVAEKFSAADPLAATRAVIRIVDAYRRRRHSQPDPSLVRFTLRGQAVTVDHDWSSIWDAATYSRDDAIRVLSGWEKALSQLVATRPQTDWLPVLDCLSRSHSAAVLWRRLIGVAKEHPTTLGMAIKEVCWVPELLCHPDLGHGIGELIRTLHPTLSLADKEQLEGTIEKLDSSLPKERQDYAARRRDVLIADCLDDQNIVTDTVRDRKKVLALSNDPLRNDAPFRMGRSFSIPYDWRAELEAGGVSMTEPENVGLAERLEPVREFGTRYSNTDPDDEAIDRFLPAFCSAAADIRDGDSSDRLRVDALGYLAEAASILARAPGVGRAALRESAAVLLRAARHPSPAANPEIDVQFARHPSWGMPAPRISGAAGLPSLARAGVAVEESVTLIGSLLSDPVPAVRYQIAARLNALYDVAPEAMWSGLERIMTTEDNPSVVLAAVAGPLPRLARRHQDRVSAMLRTAWLRFAEHSGDESELDQHLGHSLADLHIWLNDAGAGDIVLRVCGRPWETPRTADAVMDAALHAAGQVGEAPDRSVEDCVRQRAVACLRQLTNALVERVDASDPAAEAPDAAVVASLRLLDREALLLYARLRSPGADERLSPAARERFLRDLSPVIERMSGCPLLSVSHHLTELLGELVDQDPGVVLQLLRAIVVRGSAKNGHAAQHFGAQEIVALAERFLTDYPAELQSEAGRAAMIDILDAFVGWPAAQRLVFRLDELYR